MSNINISEHKCSFCGKQAKAMEIVPSTGKTIFLCKEHLDKYFEAMKKKQ